MIAQDLKAYVVEPEHRFYGESLPFGEASLDPELMKGYFINVQFYNSKCLREIPLSKCPHHEMLLSFKSWLSCLSLFSVRNGINFNFKVSICTYSWRKYKNMRKADLRKRSDGSFVTLL